MYLNTIKVELKKIIRDKMALLLVAYPLILGLVGRYLINNPGMLGTGKESEIAVQMIMVIFSITGAYLFGAVLGLNILEDREDRVFESIKVSPINTNFYIWLRTSFIFILGFLGNIFIMSITSHISIVEISIISFISALQIPIVAFFINMFANNKVEGFVAMKGSGFIFMVPVIGAFFFTDWKEFLFALSPGFWAAKATQSVILKDMGISTMLPFMGYILIGFAYEIVLITIMYLLFKRKEKI